MATKNISITESAYNKLAKLKRENESFSIVIERLTGKEKINLRDFHGVISKNAGEALENSILEGRKRDLKLKADRTKELKEMFK